MRVFNKNRMFVDGVVYAGDTEHNVSDSVARVLIASGAIQLDSFSSQVEGSPAAAAAARADIGLAPSRREMLIACNMGPLAQNSLSNGTDTTRQSRIAYVVPKACTGLRVAYNNHATASITDVETAPGNAVTVTATIEVGGIVYRCRVGKDDFGVAPDGGVLFFDPVMVDVEAGATIHILTCYTVTSGQKFAYSAMSDSGDSWMAANAGDRTGTAGAMTSSGAGTVIVGPSMVIGITAEENPPSLLLIGDSITAGVGDLSAKRGWPNRGLIANGNKIPWLNMGVGGTKLSTRADFKLTMARSQLYRYAKYALLALGSNDLSAGDAAAMLANAVKIGNKLKACGVIPYIATILPRANSTDAWATAANQTPSYDATRIAYNEAVRAGLEPFAGCIDICESVEADANNVLTKNGGRWNVVPTAPAFSGTVTTGGSSTVLTDSAAAFTGVNGWALKMTSGARNGQVRMILSSTGTTLTAEAFTGNLTAGDTYEVWNTPTADGIHPLRSCHTIIGAWFAKQIDGIFV